MYSPAVTYAPLTGKTSEPALPKPNGRRRRCSGNAKFNFANQVVATPQWAAYFIWAERFWKAILIDIDSTQLLALVVPSQAALT